MVHLLKMSGVCEVVAQQKTDCDGNCLVEVDCAGECGGSAVCEETLSISMNEGWTWISFNNNPDDLSISSMLPNDPGSDADGDGLVDGPVTYVKDQAGSATYYNGYGWYPSVFTFNNTQAYKIVSSEANTLNITGSPVDIPNTPINVNSGWNWVFIS